MADRLDVLCIDSDGRLLVAELKRGEAVDTTELQALKYAAYCSTLTTAEVVEEYSRYQDVSHEDAREAVIGHAPALQDGEPGSVRIRLLAGRFGPPSLSTSREAQFRPAQVDQYSDRALDLPRLTRRLRRDTPGGGVIERRIEH